MILLDKIVSFFKGSKETTQAALVNPEKNAASVSDTVTETAKAAANDVVDKVADAVGDVVPEPLVALTKEQITKLIDKADLVEKALLYVYSVFVKKTGAEFTDPSKSSFYDTFKGIAETVLKQDNLKRSLEKQSADAYMEPVAQTAIYRAVLKLLNESGVFDQK